MNVTNMYGFSPKLLTISISESSLRVNDRIFTFKCTVPLRCFKESHATAQSEMLLFIVKLHYLLR